MKISEVFTNPTLNKTFPIVLYPQVENNYDELRRVYYFYELNKYFGALPPALNTKKSLEMFYFYISNLSQTVIDLGYSLDNLVSVYFENNEITKKFIKDVRSYFYPILNNDPFVVYENLWDTLSRFLFMFIESVSVSLMEVYFSYVKTKVNKLYVYAYSKSECSEERLSELKEFFDIVRRKFFNLISATKNEELRNALESVGFSLFINLNDSNARDIEEYQLSLFEVYNRAEKNSYTLLINPEEIYKFYEDYDILYKNNLNTIFSRENIYYQDLNSILGGYTDGFLEYIKT